MIRIGKKNRTMSLFGPSLIELAVRTSRSISALPTAQGQTALLKRHIESSHVFVGIVADSSGGRQTLIKGQKVLNDIVAWGEPRALVRGAILVSCEEEAIAIRNVFGDGAERHWLH